MISDKCRSHDSLSFCNITISRLNVDNAILFLSLLLFQSIDKLLPFYTHKDMRIMIFTCTLLQLVFMCHIRFGKYTPFLLNFVNVCKEIAKLKTIWVWELWWLFSDEKVYVRYFFLKQMSYERIMNGFKPSLWTGHANMSEL